MPPDVVSSSRVDAARAFRSPRRNSCARRAGARRYLLQANKGATGGGLIAYGSRLVLSIDAASLAALIAKKGVVTMRRFALNPDYAGSFVETKGDAATGELMQATVGANAWRDFLAVGYEADGRQSLRPIEDMATAEAKSARERAAEGGPMIREPDEGKRSGVVKSLSGLLMQRRAAPPDLGDAAHVLAGGSAG